jgi:hypothetical protein
MTVICLIGKNIASGDIFGSFRQIGENTEVLLPEEAEKALKLYSDLTCAECRLMQKAAELKKE